MFYKYKDKYFGKHCICSKFTNIEKAQLQCNNICNDITISKWENTLSPTEAICNKCGKIVHAAQRGATSLAKAQCANCGETLITFEGRNFYKVVRYGISQKICSCKYDNSIIKSHVSNILKQNYTVSKTMI